MAPPGRQSPDRIVSSRIIFRLSSDCQVQNALDMPAFDAGKPFQKLLDRGPVREILGQLATGIRVPRKIQMSPTLPGLHPTAAQRVQTFISPPSFCWRVLKIIAVHARSTGSRRQSGNRLPHVDLGCHRTGDHKGAAVFSKKLELAPQAMQSMLDLWHLSENGQ